MKVLNKVLIGVASVAMLTACASKTDYDTFKSKAADAVAKKGEASWKSAVFSGTYIDDNGKKQSYDNINLNMDKGVFQATNVSHLDEVAVSTLLNTVLRADYVGNDENTTYYAGSTFKTVYEKDGDKTEKLWNKYGLLTAVKYSSGDSLKVSYKK